MSRLMLNESSGVCESINVAWVKLQIFWSDLLSLSKLTLRNYKSSYLCIYPFIHSSISYDRCPRLAMPRAHCNGRGRLHGAWGSHSTRVRYATVSYIKPLWQTHKELELLIQAWTLCRITFRRRVQTNSCNVGWFKFVYVWLEACMWLALGRIHVKHLKLMVHKEL